MTHADSGFLLDAEIHRIVLAIWLVAVILYGLWRSRGAAPPDPIRPSGPIA